jgi:uncharacterized protein (TIGR03503 family)
LQIFNKYNVPVLTFAIDRTFGTKTLLQFLRKPACFWLAVWVGLHLISGCSASAQEPGSSFEDTPSEGIDAVLLVDNSGTMRLSDPNRLRDEGVKLFTQFLTEKDRIAVIEFDDTPRLIQEFVAFSPQVVTELMARIHKGTLDGYYTDITAAVSFACNLLKGEGRESAAPSVILLSDGKMEPDPAKGTTEALSIRLLYDVLPFCAGQGVPVHTLTFSDDAEKDLLRKIAESSGGINWFAPSAEKIHQSFAELFLVLKKPQIVPLTQRGFRIDDGVEEATFYLNSEDVEGEIALKGPDGKVVRAGEQAPGIRWFSSSNFEVITIERPERGNWEILGVPSRESFATVLTSLKLLSDWPSSVIAGDEVLLQARLQEDDKPVVLPEMSEVLQLGFQILPTDKVAEPIMRLGLVDDGSLGDLKAGDGIFSRTVVIEEPGEYRLDIAANGPTFQRFQRMPFRVRPRLVSLSVVRIDVSDLELGTSSGQEYFRVELSQDAAGLQGINLRLTAIDERRRRIEIPLVQSRGNTLFYEAPVSDLPADGIYQVQATITGEDRKKKKVRGQSQVLSYEKVSTEIDEAEEVLVVKKEAPEAPTSPLFPILLVVLCQSGTGIFFFMKMKKQQSTLSLSIPRYTPAPELTDAINKLESKSKLTSIERGDPILAPDFSYKEAPVSTNLAAFEESAGNPASESVADSAADSESEDNSDEEDVEEEDDGHDEADTYEDEEKS